LCSRDSRHSSLWVDQRADRQPVVHPEVRSCHNPAAGRTARAPIAANVLDRDFTAAAPNQRWVSDTTEFVIGESAKLHLAAILDLYSRLAHKYQPRIGGFR
jgi:transposase InsO family protein